MDDVFKEAFGTFGIWLLSVVGISLVAIFSFLIHFMQKKYEEWKVRSEQKEQRQIQLERSFAHLERSFDKLSNETKQGIKRVMEDTNESLNDIKDDVKENDEKFTKKVNELSIKFEGLCQVVQTSQSQILAQLVQNQQATNQSLQDVQRFMASELLKIHSHVTESMSGGHSLPMVGDGRSWRQVKRDMRKINQTMQDNGDGMQ